jgi:hypothetical protein
LFERAANGTNSISLIAPESILADVALMLPTNAPSDGQALIGRSWGLAWETPAGGGGGLTLPLAEDFTFGVGGRVIVPTYSADSFDPNFIDASENVYAFTVADYPEALLRRLEATNVIRNIAGLQTISQMSTNTNNVGLWWPKSDTVADQGWTVFDEQTLDPDTGGLHFITINSIGDGRHTNITFRPKLGALFYGDGFYLTNLSGSAISGRLILNTSGSNVAGLAAINFGPQGTNAGFYWDGSSIVTKQNLASSANLSGVLGYYTAGVRSVKYGDYSAGFVAQAPLLQRMSAPFGASWQITGGDGVGGPTNFMFASGYYATNPPYGYIRIDRSATNYASAAGITVFADRDERSSITNALATATTLLITNCIPGTSGRIRLKVDGSARTVSIACGPALTVLTNTLTGYNGTNFAFSANQRGMICWDVSRETPTSTNVMVWGVNQ